MSVFEGFVLILLPSVWNNNEFFRSKEIEYLLLISIVNHINYVTHYRVTDKKKCILNNIILSILNLFTIVIVYRYSNIIL